MKTKPILIIASVVIMAIGGFLFIRSKFFAKPEKGEVAQFLTAFNEQVKAGNTDSLRYFFEADKNDKLITRFIGVITGKTSLNGKSKPVFKIALNTDNSIISVLSADLVTAVIPAQFSSDSVAGKTSSITFTIHKTSGNGYKIIKFNTGVFTADYMAYQINILRKTSSQHDYYDPMTLAAFKTAEQLKTTYDSVLWFQHVDGKTWFYVVKGKVPDEVYSSNEDGKEKSDFKMGLVNPDLKEIISPEYDLIHNVNGTIPGMIEVEKGAKKGLFNTEGKAVVPAVYDEIYPLTGGENLALLKNADNYFYLKSDFTITEKLTDFKIADVLPQIKAFGNSYILSDKSTKNLMEANSHDNYNTIVVSPSYLVDWQIMNKFLIFQNPLRKLSEGETGDGDGSKSLTINFDGSKKNADNWFESVFYSVVDDYLGGRSGLYTTKNVLLVDKKKNRVLGFNATSFFGDAEGGGELTGLCSENYLKAINDSLFEFKTTSELDQYLLDSNRYVQEGPYYHYLQIKNGKLVALNSKRIFPTQFIKMDDSYLQGCYVITTGIYGEKEEKSTISHATNEILQCMKNEIYASYRYKFKNKRWNDIFDARFYNGDDANNANVDDSLTTIDKYNISFINKKLSGQKATTLAAR